MTLDELFYFRVQYGPKQTDIADLLGTSQAAWNRYETGRRKLPRYIERQITFFLSLRPKARRRMRERFQAQE